MKDKKLGDQAQRGLLRSRGSVHEVVLFVSLFLLLVCDFLSAQDAAGRQRQALKDLSTTFSLMSVAAHPDDEDAEALTIMRMKWGVRASIVVSNYGEGGQNATGPELYEDLGGLRYHELHTAAAHYGVSRVLSLGFVDFGFSKTAEETFRFWGGQEEVTRRLVAVIRKEKPMVIITNHAVDQGHGNHRAVAIALKDAFRLAGRSDYDPDLGTPWQPLRLFQTQQKPDAAAVILQVGEVEPLGGKTYSEIARAGYLQHASQGPHPVPYIEPRVRYYKLWDFVSQESLSGADNFFSGLEQPFLPEIGKNLNVIQNRYRSLIEGRILPDPQMALTQIEQDLKTLARIGMGVSTQFSGDKRERIRASVEELAERLRNSKAGVAGLRATWDLTGVSGEAVAKIQTTADIDNLLRSRPVNEAVAGDYALFRIGIVSPLPLQVKSGSREWPKGWTEVRLLQGASTTEIWTQYGIVRLAQDAGVTEPFGLFYKKEDLPQIVWHVLFAKDAIEIPFRWTTHPRIFPRAQLAVSPNRWLTWRDQRITAIVRLTNRSRDLLRGRLTVSGSGARDVQIAPTRTQTFQWPVQFQRSRSENERIRFEGEDGTLAETEIQVRAGDLQVPSVRKVGLLRHADASTEEALRNLGVPYQIISHDELLLSGDLSQYQTILVDHRSYVLIPDLIGNNDRLLEFARNGGNLVVFYQRAGEFNTEAGYPQLSPYPLHLSSQRVSVEEASVKVLLPDHPLLRQPNQIQLEDFDHWVQERGLYYPDQWDERYQALLSCHDPGEGPLDGGLLVASIGKGAYIYTSYVWYRQWKELNNGAFRMLANLLSYSRPE
ncbi:MAG: PIG-L family deacetylase [Acidobacteria bacterium]|nr:PIG-L family deacetylase [Acidobacteriota bacterium]